MCNSGQPVIVCYKNFDENTVYFVSRYVLRVFVILPALNGPLAGVLLSKQHPNSDASHLFDFFLFLQIRFPFVEAVTNGFSALVLAVW